MDQVIQETEHGFHSFAIFLVLFLPGLGSA
jgi:hypothetical protein